MNRTDPTSGGVGPADAELELLGSTLRAEAHRRPGDLPALLERQRSRRRRSVAAVSLFAVLVVVTLVAIAGARSSGQDREVGTAALPGSGAATSASISGAATGPRPTWTVNNSIPMKGQDDIWALEVVYDPAVWTFSRFERQRSLQGTPGMAQYRTEPRLDAYWSGAGAHDAALAAQAELRGQPGILSTEVAPASAEHASPGTSSDVQRTTLPAPR